jgi:hypothetical protein
VLAERYIQPGLAFCRDRGLDAWQGMLTTLAAEAALARGRWDEAGSTAATILAWPAEGFAHIHAVALMISGPGPGPGPGPARRARILAAA